MGRRRSPVIAGIAVAACLAIAPFASAATLTGDYQFQGTRASSAAGPALTDIGAGNAFQSDPVMGTTRQVLAFPLGSGLQLAPANIGAYTGPYSVLMTFRLANVSPAPFGFARILDGTNGTAEDGLYSHNGKLDWYDSGGSGSNESTSPVLADNVYATVALVAQGGLPGLAAYVNGTFATSFEGYPNITANTLRFFKDNTNEESAGAVSCIRVYEGALTPVELAGVGASPTCGTVSAPATHRKKCKRHKKKHRSAESAKKKKCKKKTKG
jgi:hypothetical protein